MSNDKHTEREHGASTIKTLRFDVRPGASAISQLAAALTRRSRSSAGRISVTGFCFPYLPDFLVFAYPGRKPLAPVYSRRRR